MHNRGSPHSTPRWVKLFGIIVITLLLLFVSLHFVGRSLLATPSVGMPITRRRPAPLNTASNNNDDDI